MVTMQELKAEKERLAELKASEDRRAAKKAEEERLAAAAVTIQSLLRAVPRAKQLRVTLEVEPTPTRYPVYSYETL